MINVLILVFCSVVLLVFVVAHGEDELTVEWRWRKPGWFYKAQRICRGE